MGRNKNILNAKIRNYENTGERKKNKTTFIRYVPVELKCEISLISLLLRKPVLEIPFEIYLFHKFLGSLFTCCGQFAMI